MINQMARNLTSHAVQKGIVTRGQQEIYLYGLEMLIASIFNLFLVLTLGFISSLVKETILFLILFCPLRGCAGGFHCKNHQRCIISFSIFYSFFLLYSKYINITPKLFYFIIFLIDIIIIILLAPVEEKNRPISQDEFHSFKRKARLLLLIESTITVGLFFTSYYAFAIYSFTAVAIILIVGKIKNERINTHD